MPRRLLKRWVLSRLEQAGMGGHGLVMGRGLWEYRGIHGLLVFLSQPCLCPECGGTCLRACEQVSPTCRGSPLKQSVIRFDISGRNLLILLDHLSKRITLCGHPRGAPPEPSTLGPQTSPPITSPTTNAGHQHPRPTAHPQRPPGSGSLQRMPLPGAPTSSHSRTGVRDGASGPVLAGGVRPRALGVTGLAAFRRAQPLARW